MAYELMLNRLKYGQGTSEDALIKMKDRSFAVALERSYNSETVIHKDKTYKAIINKNKQKIDYDEKVISAPLEMNLHVGSTVYVPRNETRWIVTTEYLGEKAYFKGDIKRAIYEVSWRDEKDVKHTHWAAVRGPVETKIKSDPVKGVANDIPNNTLTIWIGQTDGTEALKRYSFLMVAGKVWKITVTDDVSQPGLVELQLIEALSNKDLDNKEEQIARDDKISFSCIFDRIKEFKVGESISVNPNLYINGKLMTDVHADKLEIDCMQNTNCTIAENNIIFHEEGTYRIHVGYSDITKGSTYEIKIEENKATTDELYVIEGNQRIKPMTSTFEEYTLEYYIDGVKQENPVIGSWYIDEKYATIVEQDEDKVVLKFTNTVGKTELKYIYDNQILASHSINVVSIFG